MDRHQRDWERQIIREVCAPAVASTAAARKALQQLGTFVFHFRTGGPFATDEPLDLQAYKLSYRVVETEGQMSDDVGDISQAIGMSTSAALLDALSQLLRGVPPHDFADLLDGKHDSQLEALENDIRERINRCSFFGRVLGNLVFNPPTSNSPADVEAFNEDMRSFLAQADPDFGASADEEAD